MTATLITCQLKTGEPILLIRRPSSFLLNLLRSMWVDLLGNNLIWSIKERYHKMLLCGLRGLPEKLVKLASIFLINFLGSYSINHATCSRSSVDTRTTFRSLRERNISKNLIRFLWKCPNNVESHQSMWSVILIRYGNDAWHENYYNYIIWTHRPFADQLQHLDIFQLKCSRYINMLH